MKKVVKLNEKDVEKLVKTILREHNFKMGHAEVFQGKSSNDTKMAINSMHHSEDERAFKLVGDLMYDIANALSEDNVTDADISVVLKSIFRGARFLRKEKKEGRHEKIN